MGVFGGFEKSERIFIRWKTDKRKRAKRGETTEERIGERGEERGGREKGEVREQSIPIFLITKNILLLSFNPSVCYHLHPRYTILWFFILNGLSFHEISWVRPILALYCINSFSSRIGYKSLRGLKLWFL